jgi:hypothetical protein
MTITWMPVENDVDPDTIKVEQDGQELGTVDMSGVEGMPDRIGGIAPDAVRQFVADELGISNYDADYQIEYVDGREL